jgi:hypothetical protein
MSIYIGKYVQHVYVNILFTAVTLSLTQLRKVEDCHKVIPKKIHTYHSRFIPEGVAEASQIFLRDAHV